jgi:hypothetical protein
MRVRAARQKERNKNTGFSFRFNLFNLWIRRQNPSRNSHLTQ